MDHTIKHFNSIPAQSFWLLKYPSIILKGLSSDQVEYWLSKRSSHSPAAITVPTFSDPRIEAVQKQIREAETVQAIARLRLVWAEYQKRVFLLSNLPVEMPVDHLIEFSDLMPDTTSHFSDNYR